MVKQKVVLGFLRHTEFKSVLTFVLAVLLLQGVFATLCLISSQYLLEQYFTKLLGKTRQLDYWEHNKTQNKNGEVKLFRFVGTIFSKTCRKYLYQVREASSPFFSSY